MVTLPGSGPTKAKISKMDSHAVDQSANVVSEGNV